MKAFRSASLAVASILALSAGASAAWAAKPADLVLYDGKVLTVDKAFSVKSAVAVKDGKIIAVGGDEIAKAYSAPLVIDLKGRTLMPGFMDTHLHIFGRSHREVNIDKAKSIADIQALIRAKAKALGPGEWITGVGWSEYELAEKRIPLRADLDAAAPDNPVYLIRAGAHSIVGNSMALKLAKIDRNTPDPERGLIEHDAAGEPNGVIRERRDILQLLAPLDSDEQMRPSYVENLKHILGLGITSFMAASSSIGVVPKNMGGRPRDIQHPSFQELQVIYAEHGAELPRITAEIDYPGPEQLAAYPHHTGYGDDRLRIGPIGETAVDGGFTGPTAWSLADYKGQPGFRGRGFYTPAELEAEVATSAKLGWQMGLHAIGDAAIEETVQVYDKVLSQYPKADRRWYLAHFTMMPSEQTMQTMARDGIAISQQPNFTYTLEGRYDETLEPARRDRTNSITTPLQHGIVVTFGSDNLPVNPFIGLYGAITRKGLTGAVYGPGEAVSREEAIRLYTAAGPYLSWEEDKKGTLEVGKLADMIIVPADLMTVPPEQLLHMKVDMTIVGGRVVFDRAKTPDL